MKKIYVAALLVVLCMSSAYADALQEKYTPTRQEWVKCYFSQQIQCKTNYWEKRYAHNVIVYEKEKLISIALTLANGQDELTEEQKESACNDIKALAESLRNIYDWLKDYKVQVQFVL